MLYIGIDVGGTNLKAGLVNETGEILQVARTPLGTFQSAEWFAEVLAKLAKEVMAQQQVTKEEIAWVGIGIPGAVSGGDVLG